MVTAKGIFTVVIYQDVVLYPKNVSAKAVIKCWPTSQEENNSVITTCDWQIDVQQFLGLFAQCLSPECCCMWSNLLSQSTFTCTSWPSSRGELTKCKASGPCLVTLKTGTSPISPWSSGWRRTAQNMQITIVVISYSMALCITSDTMNTMNIFAVTADGTCLM